MFSSKVYYIFVGMDLTLALLCARVHDPMAFGLVACAFIMNLIGDQRKELENKPKEGN